MEATGDKRFPWTGDYRTGPRVGAEGGAVEVETRRKPGLSGTFHCEGSREVATREDVGGQGTVFMICCSASSFVLG